jgi:general secretion pathway protein N
MSWRWNLWGALVLSVTLLLQAPAAFYLNRLPWPDDWRPTGVSGSVWNGQADRLGVLHSLSWQLQPWTAPMRLTVGFQQQQWQLSVAGWPWAWRAELAPGQASPQRTPATGFSLDGQWQGRLQIQGRGVTCLSAQGQLQAQNLGLLAPWLLPLGNATIDLQCMAGAQMRGTVVQTGEHRLDWSANLTARQLGIKGQLEAEAALTPLLIQAQWMAVGQRGFSRELKW